MLGDLVFYDIAYKGDRKMRDFVIMTDSCCDLNADEVRELELTVLPLSFRMDDKTMLDTPDHADMHPEEFFANIAAGRDCTTAAVNVGQFTDAMSKVLGKGKDILCISFSSARSTTSQSAVIAAEDLRGSYPDAKIIVIDSLSASRGLGMLVYYAVEEKRKGKTIEEVATFVQETIPHQCHWFTVADLNHLKRGGRVSAATAAVGTMLGIKPVMHMDDTGKLTAVGKARGMKAALTELVDTMETLAVKPASSQTVFLCHANCPDYADFVKELLRERFGITDVRSDFIGPVIGAHVGCGTLGLFFMGEKR